MDSTDHGPHGGRGTTGPRGKTVLGDLVAKALRAGDTVLLVDAKAGPPLPGWTVAAARPRRRRPRWPRRGPARIARGLRRVATAIGDFWLPGSVVLAGLILLAGVVWLVGRIVEFAVAVLNATSASVHQAGHAVAAGPIPRSISGPVTNYLSAHSQGLPATGIQLGTIWLVVALVLYVGALFASPYARIGWAVVGALTAFAAYAGAPHGAGLGAAVAVGVVWLLLSVPAYARSRRRPATSSSTNRTESAGEPAGQAQER